MGKLIILSILLSGCTTSISHLSDPRIKDDGYNFVCQGFEVGEKIEAFGDVCANLASNRGEFINIGVKYHWGN